MRYSERSSTLARYMLSAYLLLMIYASLHPLSGWRDRGDAFAFLLAPMPRYVQGFDVFANILGYIPLGFFGVLALYPTAKGLRAVIAAITLAGLLSIGLEALQTWLPSRFPSNLDVAANLAGALAGAILAVPLSGTLLSERGLAAIRHRWFRPGGRIDAGLVLIGLWLLTQLNPETLLFGSGDLRAIFASPTSELHPAEHFIRVEAVVVSAQTMALGLIVALLGTRNQPSRRLFVLVLVAALAVRTFAYGMLFSPQDALIWVTPGAMYGLAAGALAALIAIGLPRVAQVALCGLALMAATAVVNLAPENPYLLSSLAVWRQGHFFNLNGVTRVVSAAWPFAAIACLLAVSSDRRHDRS